MLSWVLLLLLVLLVTALFIALFLHTQRPDTFVHGGVIADGGVIAAVYRGRNATKPYPWLCTMEVFYDGAWVITCAGTLISPTVVVSAGHCPIFYNYVSLAKHNQVRLCLGRWSVDSDDGVEFRTMKAAYMFDTNVASFNDLDPTTGKNKDDVSVIILDRPSSHAPARLADANFVPKGPMKIIGFGQNSFNAKTMKGTVPKVLQEASVSQIPCTDKDSISRKLLCAINPQTGASGCEGDSGGPLFVEDPTTGQAIVFGATSGGGNCGSGPGAWTDLRLYVPWIKSFINNTRITNTPLYPKNFMGTPNPK